MTDDAYRYILDHIAPPVLDDFIKKSHDYGETFKELGTKGQFSDMYRKVGKLKRAIWDEYELAGEQPAELAADIIGHCLLMIFLIGEEEGHEYLGRRRD